MYSFYFLTLSPYSVKFLFFGYCWASLGEANTKDYNYTPKVPKNSLLNVSMSKEEYLSSQDGQGLLANSGGL